jgi:septal ring factor EnvC (AmiA/AmiB activator)
MDSVEYQLGEIRAELRSISQRLDEGSKRHRDLDESDDDLKRRLAALEMVEAKRAGVMATIAALAGIVGGAITLAVQLLIKKF